MAAVITVSSHAERGYEEFPSSADLAGFDPSDRKFVAAAAADGPDTRISVALDRGWRNHESALANASITVEFLCPRDLPPSRS